MGDPTRVIEHLYSAAIDATQWSAVVSTLQWHYGATCAGIYSVDLQRGAAEAVHLSGLDPDSVRVYLDDYLLANPWADAPALQAPGTIRTDRSLDEHFDRPGYYRSTPYFNDFMKPRDFIHTLGVNMLDDRRTRIKLFLYRPSRGEPFSAEDVRDLKRLTGHLTNAAKLARRVAEEQVRAEHTLAVFDRLSFGVVLLDERGRVLEANPCAASMFSAGDGIQVDGDVLVVSHRDDAASFAAGLRVALSVRVGDTFDAPRTVCLRRASGKEALQAMIVPLPNRAGDPFFPRQAAVAVVITDPERAAAIPSLALERRYGLTRTETSLAQSLARGISLREAADLAGVTYETARSYLKRILEKTGTSRQSELVSRLLSDRLLVHLGGLTVDQVNR